MPCRLFFSTLASLLVSAILAPSAVWAAEEALSSYRAPAQTAQGDILQTAAATGDFDTFIKLAKLAKLDEVLEREGPFTVFAPTDQAFDALPQRRLEELEDPAHMAELAQILSYHIVVGEVISANMSGKQSVESLEGRELVISATMNSVKVNGADLIAADIRATNGIIHGIDAVLSPPDKPSYIATKSSQ